MTVRTLRHGLPALAVPARMLRALILGLTAVAFLAPAAFAQWPTTCVALNDIVEGHLGNDGNVGIYQRAFGDQAEQACRNDHRDDVRGAFAWAIGGDEPAMQPAAVPAPAPAPPTSSTAEAHPDFGRVRQAAVDRGASSGQAVDIATSVISRNAVQVFLAGFDTAVEYGVVAVVASGQGETISNIVGLPSGNYIVTVNWQNNAGRFSSIRYNFFADLVTLDGASINLTISNGPSGSIQTSVNIQRNFVNVFVEVDAAQPNATWQAHFQKIS